MAAPLPIRLAVAAGVLAAAGLAAFWVLTLPRGLSAAEIAALPAGDPVRGERMFWAGGCDSCHAAKGATGAGLQRLGGGLELVTDFGTFVAPNISPHPEDGIGSWTEGDFANAMLRGIGPGGTHLYPAFPYTSYARMTTGDVADLWAYLRTLPPVEGKAAAHRLEFPFTLRRGIGLWKLAFLSSDPVVPLADDAPEPVLRGRYLMEGPGHCGECHTPRDFAGGPDLGRWLAGAPNPEGQGRIPDITPAGDIGSWSEEDIAYYLETGFTPDFDLVGGSMAAVQRNMANLPPEDRAAMAAYLKAVPAVAP